MNEETVNLNYEIMYKELNHKMQRKLYEQDEYYKEKIEKEKNTNTIIINELNKRIEFYENIIKGILNIR